MHSVHDWFECTPAQLVAAFRAVAGPLNEWDGIRLVMWQHPTLERLEAVLRDPLAHKIEILDWSHVGHEDVSHIIPLLPNLTSLRVLFLEVDTIDFLSSALERCPRIKGLTVPHNTTGDLPRFFAALRQVTSLTTRGWGSPEFFSCLCAFLAENRLASLVVLMHGREVPAELLAALDGCTWLKDLTIEDSKLVDWSLVPRSIETVTIKNCRVYPRF